MKKQLFFLLALCMVCGVSAGCQANKEAERVAVSTNNGSRVVNDIEKFNQLVLEGIGTVDIVQSDKAPFVEIDAPEEYLDKIIVKSRNGRLTISYEKNSKLWNPKNKDYHFVVGVNELQLIKNQGVGHISAEALHADKLQIVNAGVGAIDINALKATLINVKNEGTGLITLAGDVDAAGYDNEGVGKIDAQKVAAQRVEAVNEGTGSIVLTANQSLKASVDGVGNITYYGSPKEKKFSRGGLGKIVSK